MLQYLLILIYTYASFDLFALLYRWISTVDGRPGFSDDALNFLKKKINSEESWRFKRCVLIIDGMHIKKLLEYDQHSRCFRGFVDYGRGLDDDNETLATEALVFLASGVHGFWKIPIAYFLIKGISATVQHQLVVQALQLLHKAGVEVVAFTLDGHQTNMATIRKLGCSTDPDDLVTSFPHPVTSDSVHVFIDACHGLKLIRNQFFSLENIQVPSVGVAKWKHIHELNKFQQEEFLSAANKLTDKHIAFSQQKMKVSL